MARLKAASLALAGLVKPLSLRTNCSADARISSSVAGGLKLCRVLIFRHIRFGSLLKIGHLGKYIGEKNLRSQAGIKECLSLVSYLVPALPRTIHEITRNRTNQSPGFLISWIVLPQGAAISENKSTTKLAAVRRLRIICSARTENSTEDWL